MAASSTVWGKLDVRCNHCLFFCGKISAPVWWKVQHRSTLLAEWALHETIRIFCWESETSGRGTGSANCRHSHSINLKTVEFVRRKNLIVCLSAPTNELNILYGEKLWSFLPTHRLTFSHFNGTEIFRRVCLRAQTGKAFSKNLKPQECLPLTGRQFIGTGTLLLQICDRKLTFGSQGADLKLGSLTKDCGRVVHRSCLRKFDPSQRSANQQGLALGRCMKEKFGRRKKEMNERKNNGLKPKSAKIVNLMMVRGITESFAESCF